MSHIVHPAFKAAGTANTREACRKAWKARLHALKIERYHKKLAREELEKALRNGVWSEEQRQALDNYARRNGND